MRTGKGAGETILGRTVGTGGRYECAFRRSNCFPSGRGAKEMDDLVSQLQGVKYDTIVVIGYANRC